MSTINYTELDFAKIKENLKTYLQGQSEFSDYDFSGSGLNILLDILAYNTAYNAFYLNMIGNEAFLDSAILRNSVVSRAKAISYVPRSKRSAVAYITITFSPNDSPANILIPAGTKFNTKIDNKNYTFNTVTSYLVKPVNNQYVQTEVKLVEGEKLTHRFTVDSSTDVRYIIPNPGVDTTTLVVKIQNSASDSTAFQYTLANDINELTPDSKVYFIQEVDGGLFEIYFGDGVVGKKPANGNIVIIDYIVSSGSVANKASSFEPTQKIAGYNGTIITTTTAAFGGMEEETVDSIKFLAPLNYESQNRAVTKQDYETLIQKDFPTIDAVRVWGGEDNTPPEYGRVFVSIKPVEGLALSETVKDYVANTILKKRNLISVQVVIVDPTYVFLDISTTIKYRSTLTTDTAGEIKQAVIDSAVAYGQNNLDQFDGEFRYSKFVNSLDSSHESIQGNLTTIKMKYQLRPSITVPAQYIIEFNNAIQSNPAAADYTLQSTEFIYNGFTAYFKDDGLGALQIYRLVNGVIQIIKDSAGSINYSTGKIIINSFLPESIPTGEDFIEISVYPKNNDILTERSQLLLIAEKDVTVTLIDEDLE